MTKLQDEFIPFDGYDDDDNSNNKNKKRKKSVEFETLQPPKKKRQQTSDNGISKEEVCLMVLFTLNCCKRYFLRFCVIFNKSKDAFMADFHNSCVTVFGILLFTVLFTFINQQYVTNRNRNAFSSDENAFVMTKMVGLML